MYPMKLDLWIKRHVSEDVYIALWYLHLVPNYPVEPPGSQGGPPE